MAGPARSGFLCALALALAGCLAASRGEEPLPPDANQSIGPSTNTWVLDGVHYFPNLWLLDAPKPASVHVSNGAEPSMLADTLGRYLWIGEYPNGLFISTDNGDTWKRSRAPFLLGLCDGLALAQDGAGRLFVGANSGCVSMSVARSSDGGFTWDNMGLLGQALDVATIADRPWVAARGNGEVAAFYYDYGRTFSENCIRSTDGGQTWLDRYPVLFGADAGNAVFDADGNLYYNAGYYETRALTWRFKGTCQGGADSLDMFPKGRGNQVFVQVEAGPDGLYAAAPTKNNDAIVLAGTRDFRNLKHLVVSPQNLRVNTFATVTSAGDRVAVGWYGTETEGDPAAVGFKGSWNVFVAQVDGFWSPSPRITYHRITSEPNHVGDICMFGSGCGSPADRDLLDYFMMDYGPNGDLHIAYGHDGDGRKATVRYARIAESERGWELGPSVSLEPTVTNKPPVARFTYEVDDLVVRANGRASSDPDGQVEKYAWDWGDGSTGDQTATAAHRYSRAGTYVVTLSVWDNRGATNSAARNVTVQAAVTNHAPDAGWHLSVETPRVGERFQFLDDSFDPDGQVVAWTWDLGDGSVVRVQNPNYVYSSPGTYKVSLTVEDDRGARDAEGRTVTVRERAPSSPTPSPTRSAPESGVPTQAPASGERPAAATPGLAWAGILAALAVSLRLSGRARTR